MAFRKIIVPRLSGVHRFACLALYRGLLRQCAKLPTNIPELNTSRSLVKQRFRRYKSLQSPSQTVNALKAGYEAFDLLHSAARGDEQGIKRITDLVTEAQSIKRQKIAAQQDLAEATPVKPLTKGQIKKAETQRKQELTARRHPDATPILSRPRPVVSGKRHIPRLVSARGVPFLRIKKPQPKNLSGVIRSKLENRWAWFERRYRLEEEHLFCRDEDQWDSLTGTQEVDSKWATGVEDALSTVDDLIYKTDMKNKELAEKMWQVVLAERQLAAKEKEGQQNEQKQTTNGS